MAEREEEEEEEEVVVVVVFTRENRGGSTQHAKRATPTRSSHEGVGEESECLGAGRVCVRTRRDWATVNDVDMEG